MSGSSADDEVARGELTRGGWRQGSLFSLPTACLLWNDLDEEGAEPGTATLGYASLEDDDLLVVASQDCDLDARGATEPYVEAIVCRVTSDATILRAARRNSSRWFLLDKQHNLVAYATDRLQIDKHVLRAVTPQPWPGPDDLLDRFRRWLARRYERPAIPDRIVEAFQRPMNKRMDHLEKHHSTIFEIFNKIVHDMRINVPINIEPPFSIGLLLVTTRLSLSESEAQAIDRVVAEISQAFDGEEIVFQEPRILHPEEISYAEYLATRPLLYDYLTYRGEDIIGAEPLVDP